MSLSSKIWFSILLMGLLISCDKRTDFLKYDNNQPVVGLDIQNEYQTESIYGNTITDSCKTGYDYDFQLAITDESEECTVSYVGDGELYHQGVIVNDLEVTNGVYHFVWKDTMSGFKTFVLTIKDSQGAETSFVFNITVFDNIPPVISWEIFHVGNLDPLEKKIVVSGNDKDYKYGGSISYYRFMIDGDTTDYSGNEMNYIFPSPGNYDIGVVAVDNQGAFSNEITINNYLIN